MTRRISCLPQSGIAAEVMGRLENLLGAQALALSDPLDAAGSGAVARSASECAALVTLLAHPDESVSWLGGVLGLTSSGITRLVDRMVDAGGDAYGRGRRAEPASSHHSCRT